MPLGPGVGISVTSGSTKDRMPSESAQPPTGHVTTRTIVATAGDSQCFSPQWLPSPDVGAIEHMEHRCQIRRSTLNPRAGS